MDLITVLVIVLVLLILLSIFIQIQLGRKDKSANWLKLMEDNLEKAAQQQRQEFSASRSETHREAIATREELLHLFAHFQEALEKQFTAFQAIQEAQLKSAADWQTIFTKNQEEKFEKFITSQLNQQENFRKQLGEKQQHFEENFQARVKGFNEYQRQKFMDLANEQDKLRTETVQYLEKIRETLEKKIQYLQDENSRKLEQMRLTVDEKLNATLEKRFNESFHLISNRLEQVHKGLGEMQHLAVNVGDLKKVMTNVKARGVIGEYQLANILEDLLTNEQYGKNVKTKKGSSAMVEFAIKMPHHAAEKNILWLPIDAKFPKEDYEALVDAYETGDAEKIDLLRKSFRAGILKNARDIKEKYIDPPNTTEYGIMFLPFESLYAEVLRIPGLFEQLQKEYKITVTGPATLSALLNALQMGFRTLAIEKRSSEVWDLLSKVKTEFNLFGNILDKTKKKLQEATHTIDQAGTRSRAIERQLHKVQELPGAPATGQLTNPTTRFELPDSGSLPLSEAADEEN